MGRIGWINPAFLFTSIMSLNSFPKVCLFLLGFWAFVPGVLADFATCQAGWEWANNTRQQNPCEIAGALEAACEGFSVYVLGPLSQGTNYVSPQKNSSSKKCQCNTVQYSLYMACTACQNVTTQTWSFWSQFCDQVYVTQYPETIPSSTAVPHWAYLNYTVGDKFDPVTAKAAGGLPEVLAPVPSTISLSSTSSGSGSTSMMVVSTSTSTGQGDNRKKSSNAGAIAGGVVAGLVALAAIGVGVWIFLRRRAMSRGNGSSSDYFRVSTGAPGMSEHGTETSHLRLYDPSDPSTYPSHTDYDPSEPHTTAPHNGHYSGAAEL